jgi:serine protease Do
VVTRVGDDSPAAKAGVSAGDVITKVNGQAVHDARELIRITSSLPIGQVVDVLLWRDGKFYIGKVKIAEYPAANPEPNPAPNPNPPAPLPAPGVVTSDGVGLVMTDLTAELAKQQKLPKDLKGAVISNVTKNGLAEKSGLARGLIVLKVDKTPVGSALAFEQALRQADPEKGAVLHVMKPNGDVDFVVLRLK